ncbi:hypothetical protein [Microvirga yunnanensis]|uniref:hypothetical protein n=1 Tax=Microvirga yunnanensis TaxID=2953740 RepID=UPI0021C5B15F|nr:hypothetical protein [Microvirga sp. HBU65207]
MAPWRQFAITLLGAAAILLTGFVALAYVIDPYDTGRSSLFTKPGVRPQGPRTANASRGRDQAFNAVIVGNSHIQLLAPDRLKHLTGLNFVQLATPASGAKEHLKLIDWFLRHRKEAPKAVVVSIDDFWCRSDPELPNDKPFPFWLYSANPLEYVRGLVRFDVLEEVSQRIDYLFRAASERARPDGYWDYEPEYIGLGYTTDPGIRRRLDQKPYADAVRYDHDPKNAERRFPAVARLRELAVTLPEETALLLVMPPVYGNALPPPGTEQAFLLHACKAAAQAVQRDHTRTAVVDWLVDRPEIHVSDLFFDTSHYRQPIAKAIEADIAAALRRLP